MVGRAHMRLEHVQEAAASVDAQGVGATKACHTVLSLAFFLLLIFLQDCNRAGLQYGLRANRKFPGRLKQNDV